MTIYSSLLTILANINWLQITAICTFTAVIYIVLQAAKTIFNQYLKKLSARESNSLIEFFIDLLASFHWPFYLALSLVIIEQWIETPVKIQNSLNQILMIIFSFYLTLSINQFIKHALDRYQQKETKIDPSVMKVIQQLVQIVIWIIAILFVLQNLGYEISTLIGGLGIAGVSVAFGVKNILEDVLSYFSISFDKPFQTGDYIVLGDDSGNVKKIGLKSTRIQTLRGEELVISNQELTQSRIRNFKKMTKRRDSFEIRVGIKTPPAKLQKFKQKMQQIIEDQEKAEFDRVYFSEIDNGSFVFSATYYLAEKDYETFAQTKENINFALVKSLQKADIRLATNIPIIQPS